jgi:hypothetical protein
VASAGVEGCGNGSQSPGPEIEKGNHVYLENSEVNSARPSRQKAARPGFSTFSAVLTRIKQISALFSG